MFYRSINSNSPVIFVIIVPTDGILAKSYRFGVLNLHQCHTLRVRCRKPPFLCWAEDARLQSAAWALLLQLTLRFLVG